MGFTPCSGCYLPWRTNHPNHRGEDAGGSSAHAHVCSDAAEEHDSETRLDWSDDSIFSGDHAWRPKLDAVTSDISLADLVERMLRQARAEQQPVREATATPH